MSGKTPAPQPASPIPQGRPSGAPQTAVAPPVSNAALSRSLQRATLGDGRQHHGVGGWLHERFYEPGEAFWKQQLARVGESAQAWNASLPGLGYVGGVLAGSPTIVAADLSLIVIYALELVTPLTEEEHFFVAATMGSGEVAIPVIHAGRWIMGALSSVFARHPELARRVLPRIPDFVRGVFQKLAAKFEKKAVVDPFARTDPALVDPFAKTDPVQLPASTPGRSKRLAQLEEAAKKEFGESAGQRFKALQAADESVYDDLAQDWARALHEESKLPGFDLDKWRLEMSRLGIPRKVQGRILDLLQSEVRLELYEKNLLAGRQALSAAHAAEEAFERQLEKAAAIAREDQTLQAAWGAAAHRYPHWDRVEAFFKVANIAEDERRVARQWLGHFAEQMGDAISFERMVEARIPGRVRSLIADMWHLGRTGKLIKLIE